jgi:SAM-dependent methyltransferase
MHEMNQHDRLNQTTWAASATLDWLGSLEGFVDAGERVAYARIAERARDQPILDLGVGAGRTIPMLQSLSRDYVAIDYTPAMVERARQRFPGVDIQLGDARDLSRFRTGSFCLVVFSFAGIDAIGHEGRHQVFGEVSRVLSAGGIFWFSTLNKDGSMPGRRPWRAAWPQRAGGITRQTIDILRTVKQAAVGIRNYYRLHKLQQEGEGWLVAPFFAHAYGLLVHYTTLACQMAVLESLGFCPDPEVFDENGVRVRPGDDLSRADFFNILACKRPGAVTTGTGTHTQPSDSVQGPSSVSPSRSASRRPS